MKKRSQADPFEELTWNDLQKWAGTKIVSRGRSYQRHGLVRALARTPEGGLVAWVQGTHKYATRVDFEREELTSLCTCPYQGRCKHAVAVVLEYLECLQQSREVPQGKEDDRRLMLVKNAAEAEPMGDGWEEDDDDEENIESEEGIEISTSKRKDKAVSESLHSFLEPMTKTELIALLSEIAGRYPDVRQALDDRRNLSGGTVAKLVTAVRRQIHRLSETPGWTNDWSQEGYLPDYTPVRDRLEALLAKGYADEVIQLGEELRESGKNQVEMSHDEGETAEEIASCLDVVFRALSQSSLSPAEQVLWAVEAELQDDYELCRGIELVLKKKHAAKDWNIVADKLIGRLGDYPSSKDEDSFSRNYRRDRLTGRITLALKNAGRRDEIVALCESEAEKTGSYVCLVNFLMKAQRWEKAEQWIHKGIKATQKKWPGIAGELRQSLRKLREREKDWLGVTAIYAEEFFEQPGLDSFKKLEKAAKRAGVWPAVRAGAMRYMETGKLPIAGAEDANFSAWPLPAKSFMDITESERSLAPMVDILIDIAIAEKQPDEVLRWYDRGKQKPRGWWRSAFQEDKVAQAIVDRYPDRSIEIWKKVAEREIAHTKPSAYEEAGSYLRKVSRVLTRLGREQEWKDYLTKLREANRRKRRLLEVLEDLTGRRIIQAGDAVKAEL